MDIYERILPEKHPHLAFTYNMLASAYGKMEDYDSSLDYELTTIGLYECLLPPGHPRLIASYKKAGDTYAKLGNSKKESEYLQKASNA